MLVLARISVAGDVRLVYVPSGETRNACYFCASIGDGLLLAAPVCKSCGETSDRGKVLSSAAASEYF